MRIAVDIDDTLNIVDRVGRTTAYVQRKGLPFKVINERSNWFLHVLDWTEEDVAEFMRDGGLSAFTEAPARKGAREALTRWRQAGHEVIILTARHQAWFGNPAMLSRDWLEKQKIPFDQIVAEQCEKGKYCKEHGISILVDDSPEHLREAQSFGVNAVLAVGKHNLEYVREFRYFGENWKQIDEAVQRILSQQG